MKTAKEMIDFIIQKNIKPGKGMIKAFDVVEETLLDNEEVFYCMGAFSASDGSPQIALGITNSRVIAAQKKMFSNTVITISLNCINDITFKRKLTGDYITIANSSGDNLTISTYKGIGQEIVNALHNAIDSINSSSASNINNVEEIRKYKSLLDDGIITIEEFQKKKQQLLGI